MLEIIENGYESPNGTYFTTEDAQPELVEVDGVQVLKLVNGVGDARSWGRPGVTSTVVLTTDDLVAIHVGFFHKHGGGQFWRYYWLREDGSWERAEWPKLPDAVRERILIAAEDRAPEWAKTPGKLRKNYLKPSFPVYTTYKLVEVIDGHYFSVYDEGKTEYILGKRLVERAVSHHGGGYYSYPTADGAMALFEQGRLSPSHRGGIFPDWAYDSPMTLALLECEISGHIEQYSNGKCASTYLRPVAVLDVFEYAPDIERVG